MIGAIAEVLSHETPTSSLTHTAFRMSLAMAPSQEHRHLAVRASKMGVRIPAVPQSIRPDSRDLPRHPVVGAISALLDGQ
jgi:hypothetical protein